MYSVAKILYADEIKKLILGVLTVLFFSPALCAGSVVPMIIPLVQRVSGVVNTHDFNRAVFISQDPSLNQLEALGLIYPVGVAGFETYSGRKFNQKAWQKVPIFLTNGAQDFNDPLPYPDCFGDEDRTVSKQILGDGNCQ